MVVQFGRSRCVNLCRVKCIFKKKKKKKSFMPHVARSIRACVRARWQSQFGTEKYSNFIHKNLVLFQSSKYIYIYIWPSTINYYS